MKRNSYFPALALLCGLLCGCAGQQSVFPLAQPLEAHSADLMQDPVQNPAQDLAQETAQALAVYAPYGMTYDEQTGTLTYHEQRVRQFVDIFSTNGQDPESGKFEGSMTSRWDAGGTVDVSAVRDYTRPDRQGWGTLTGIQVATAAEFDAATQKANESVHQVQFYHVNTTNCVEVG